MTSIQKQASEALKNLALDENAKSYLLNNPILFNLVLKAAKRYIGGENLTECVKKVKEINQKGIRTTIDYMGESIRDKNEATEVTNEFLELAKQIKKENLNSTISLDLSHIGLSINAQLAYDNLELIAKSTQGMNTEIIISAEGTDRTDSILYDIFHAISPKYSHIGITLQAYLLRTPKDLEAILKNTQGKVRIVKGAFATERGLSIERGKELNNQYIKLIETLLKSERKCSIATHHDVIQEKIKKIILKNKFNSNNYEFEMLYGIREDLLEKMYAEGHPCRQYVVYGKEWFLYLCNRTAENPENLFQVFLDIMN